jgi:23S rRNA C2498 (ribose-2'-O)-methylase RlmM
MGTEPIVRLCEEILPKLEEYRSKNINKYYREKESPDCEYTKTERYKNRVRVADIFLDPIRNVLSDAGFLQANTEPDEQEIP